MADFEVFLWGIKLRINFLYLKSGGCVVGVFVHHTTLDLFVFLVSHTDIVNNAR